ncbi:MAG: hypothetical protein ACJ763_01515 [Bdellovibrionia bacterium]
MWARRRSFILALNIFLCVVPAATCSAAQWTVDEGGMPRCVSTGNKTVLYQWNLKDSYARKIHSSAIPMSCERWMEGIGAPQQTLRWGNDSEILQRLEQVKQGGNVYHEEPDGATYLAHHPIREFTLETNRELSKRYGKGFAGEVYQAWIESQPANAAFRARYLKTLSSIHSARPSKRERGLRALVVMGLGWDQDIKASTPDYVKNFVTEIQQTGIETTILRRPPLGTYEENVALLVPQIETQLRAGGDIILFGLCKGSTEMLAATSQVLSSYLDSERTQKSRPAGYGRIVAVINLSGMFRGTFFSEFAGSLHGTRTLGRILRKMPIPKLEEAGEYERALPSISVEHLSQVRSQFITGLPSDAVYLEVVGVVPGNGLIANDAATMRTFQNLDRALHLSVGANDGFIEYPGNTLPNDVSPYHSVIVFNGTHMLTDGTVGSFDLSDRKTRVNAYQALYQTVLEQVETMQ